MRRVLQVVFLLTITIVVIAGGAITWIAENAEFTPKTIQTKEERVNLVYAFKARVVNDGKLKIGMPAEILFKDRAKENQEKSKADASN